MKKQSKNKAAPWLKKPLEHRAIESSNCKATDIAVMEERLGDLARFYKNLKCSEDITLSAHLFESDFTRMYMNAFVFGGASDEDISEITGLVSTVVSLYRYFFIDLTVVSDSDILLRDYIWRMEDDLEKYVYSNSISYGWQWAHWRYSGGRKGTLDADEVLQHLATDSYWRAKEGMQHPITSKEAKESRNYARNAVDTATSIKRANVGSINAAEQLYLTLTSDTNYMDSLNPEELDEIKKKLYN